MGSDTGAAHSSAASRSAARSRRSGWGEVEVLHGRLPPLEQWPLLRRALAAGSAVHRRLIDQLRDLTRLTPRVQLGARRERVGR